MQKLILTTVGLLSLYSVSAYADAQMFRDFDDHENVKSNWQENQDRESNDYRYLYRQGCGEGCKTSYHNNQQGRTSEDMDEEGILKEHH